MSYEYGKPSFEGKINREVIINGERIYYDTCDSRSLEEAREMYPESKWQYLGIGSAVFINGTENKMKETLHFFRFKQQ